MMFVVLFSDWVNPRSGQEQQLPLPALLSPGIAHRLHQTRFNYIIFWGTLHLLLVLARQGEHFQKSSQKTITGAILIFKSCSYQVNSTASPWHVGSDFLTAAPRELVSECRLTCLGLGLRLVFPAAVKVVYRFTVFCPHRCWRESGRHPGQPYFHIPAFLEYAWSFAIQDEAELAQPMHHILLIR